MSFLDRLFGKGGKSASPALLDFGAYAHRYAAAVRRAYPGTEVRVDIGASAGATAVRWTSPSGLQAHQYMGNWYARYRDQPAALEALLAEQLAAAADMDTGAAQDDRGLLLPLLKTRAWQTASNAQLANAGITEHPLARALAEPLVITYVEDRPSSMQYVLPQHLSRLGLDETALHERALQNLASLLPRLSVQGGDGRYAARLDGNYDATMVLLFDLWRAALTLRGEPVLAIAARDELLVCGSEDIEAVSGLQAMASRIAAESAYGLSDRLFVWWRGGLVPWTGGPAA